MSIETLIIGIDCATQPKKIGLALGLVDRNGAVAIREVGIGKSEEAISARLKDWINQSSRTLIAMDAPLGWPVDLPKALSSHRAGNAIDPPKCKMFRRATDRFIAKKVRKTPLDVGADRIARTAHASLALLNRLRQVTQLPIPLAWDEGFDEPVAAIEVYPAATLKAWEQPFSRYKDSHQSPKREEILRGMYDKMGTKVLQKEDQEAVLGNADMLDATICVLAGRDFLEGWAFKPSDQETARTEGWIWVLDKNKFPQPDR